MQLTEFADWHEVTEWGLETFGQYNYPLPAALDQRILAWRRAARGDAVLFSNLALRYVQDRIRYLGLEIGVNTHQPRKPAEVCTSGFGDCKDKALLLAMILRHENIEAYVALVNTVARPDSGGGPAGAKSFRSRDVAIKRGNGFLYVDPTISGQRGDFVENYIGDYGFALVIKPASYGLVPVDAGFLDVTTINEKADLTDTDGSTLSVKTLFKGGAADDVRSLYTSESEKNLESDCINYYAKTYEGVNMLSPIGLADDSIKNEFTLTESYSIPHAWHEQPNGRLTFDVYAKPVDERLPAVPAKPGQSPLALTFPETLFYNFELLLPENFPAGLEEVHIKNASYQFDFTPHHYGNKIVYAYYLKTFRDFIPAAEVKQFRDDYKRINDCLNIRLTRGTAGSVPDSPRSPAAKPTGPSNFVTLWITLLFLVLFSGFFRYLDKRNGHAFETPSIYESLGGWTAFLGCSLVFRLGFTLYSGYKNYYFSRTVWDVLGNTGGAHLQAIYLTEFVEVLLDVCGLGALLYWFFKKRDIFPAMFTAHLAVLIGFRLLIAVLYHSGRLPDTMIATRNAQVTLILSSFCYAGIWITYLRRSQQVRNTFVHVFAD